MPLSRLRRFVARRSWRDWALVVAPFLVGSMLIASTGGSRATAAPVFDPHPVRVLGGPGHAGLYGWGVARMLDGTMLVGDYLNKRVVRYDSDGTPLGTFINNVGYADSQHQSPYGMGVDPVTGDIYLADTDNRQVDKYSADGTYLLSIGTVGTGPGKFQYPSRVAVSPDRRVYIVDSWDHLVSVHQPDGTELFAFGGLGSGNGKFRQIHGAAFDAAGRIFVADEGNRRIQVFDGSGVFLFKFGSEGSGPGQFLFDLRGVAIDQAQGWVYVVDAGGNQVEKFDTSGNFIESIGSEGIGDGQFTDGGREIAVGPDGRIWVGDMPNFRVQVFEPDGTFAFLRPDPPAPPPLGRFNAPRGVAVDSNGAIFVTDTANQRIQKLDANGEYLAGWGSRGRGNDRFNYARLIATDPVSGDVVVVDTDNHVIKKFTGDGTFVWAAAGVRGSGVNQMRNPHGVDIAPNGTIYVTDANNDRIVVLGSDGSWIGSFGTSGTGDGQFLFPRGVAVDPLDGTLWVSDSNRNDVQHLTANGVFISRFGSAALGPNRLLRPFDVEVGPEWIFVASSGTHEVKAFDRTGTYVGTIGGFGTGLGRLSIPQGMELTPDGHLYVAEQGNDRVTEFAFQALGTSGTVPSEVASFGGPGHAAMYPSGLETTPGGGIVVADTGNSRLRRYDASGALLWSVGGQDDGPGELDNPRDAGVDPVSGQIYVADTGNNRVAVFSAAGAYLFSLSPPDGAAFSSVIGVTVRNNRVLVADAGRQQVRIFNLAGNHIRSFGSSGACVVGQLRDIDADASNNVYIANYTLNTIVKMSGTGTCLLSWGTKGTGPGQFANPYGVAVETPPGGAARVHVADSNNNRVQVFTTAGVFVEEIPMSLAGAPASASPALRRVAVDSAGAVWMADLWGNRAIRFTGGAGAWTAAQTIGGTAAPLAPTQVFNEVRSPTFTAAGDLVAVDTVNHRIVTFAPDGSIASTCGNRGFEEIGGFNWPRGVAADPVSGYLWVADTKQNRLQVLRPDCTAVTRIGASGSGATQFNWPHAIAYRASDQTMWVADTRNNRIKVYSATTQALLATFGTRGAGVGQFDQPRGISVDPNGQIWVADTRNDRVVALDVSAGATTFATARVISGLFNGPEGVAADDEGRIYVADTQNDQVTILDSSGTPRGVLRGFLEPASVTVGPDGHLYVADTYQDRVVEYAWPTLPPPPPALGYEATLLDGAVPDMYPVDIAASASRYYVLDPGRYRIVGINRATGAIDVTTGDPTGLPTLGAARALDRDSTGKVYVADTGDNQIVVYGANLNFLREWGATGTGPGEFQRVYGVAVGPGNTALGEPAEVVYAVDDPGRIQVFTLTGDYLREFGGAPALDSPRQMSVNPVTGNLYVISARDREVVVFDPLTGVEQFRFGGAGSGPGQFNDDPRGITISADQRVFVTDAGNHRVQEFTATGTFVAVIGSQGAGAGQFTGPRGLAVTADGLLAVADEWDFAVEEFTIDGTHVRRLFGTPPPVDGVHIPRGVAVDGSGRVLSVDWWNQRVVEIDPDGTDVSAYGYRGDRSDPGSLNFAYDVAVQPSTQRRFVANREGHEIVVFAPDGSFVTRFGVRGAADGQFTFPTGVAFDPDGTLLVADSTNDRIQRFSIAPGGVGTWIQNIGQSGNRAAGAGFLNNPTDVAVAADGTLWVTDTFNNSIQRRLPDGTWTRYITYGGTELFDPRGIDVADDGSVWIADAGNNRIVAIEADGVERLVRSGTDLGIGAFAYPFGIAAGPAGAVYVSDMWHDRVVALRHFHDAVAPETTLGFPAQASLVVASDVDVRGSASDDGRVDEVRLTVRDLATGDFWQGGVAWGETVEHFAELSAPGAVQTPWTFRWLPSFGGNFEIVATAYDAYGRPDPTPVVRQFSYELPAPGQAYLTLMFGRTQWQQLEQCNPIPGTVPLDRVADDLTARGLTAVGPVVIDRTNETTRVCDNQIFEHASWADLAMLRDVHGWSFISNGTTHDDITLMTPAQQLQESCGSLPPLEAHGHDRAWGLFAYGNNRYTQALQTNLVSTCFSYGRRYFNTINDRSTMSAPWFTNTRSYNGGKCNNAALACFTMTVPTNRFYESPTVLASLMAPGPEQWSIVQLYRFVEGSKLTGVDRWDCTSSDWRNHYTSRPELYCYNDYLSAIDTIPTNVSVTDPATVAENWGRGNPNQ